MTRKKSNKNKKSAFDWPAFLGIFFGLLVTFLPLGYISFKLFGDSWMNTRTEVIDARIEYEGINIDMSVPKTYEVYKNILNMSNSFLIFNESSYYEEEDVTYEKVGLALFYLQAIDLNMYDKLLKWYEGDFSNVMDVHNYAYYLLYKSVDEEVLRVNEDLTNSFVLQ